MTPPAVHVGLLNPFERFSEIAVWALFFWWQKCLPDAESSFYFSGVTYYDGPLRGFRAAEGMAAVRPGGGIDGHFDVWVFRGIFLRYFEQNVQEPDETNQT